MIDDRDELTIGLLGHLAGNPEALERFYALTGYDPSNLRADAATPEFMTAILEFYAQDEPLLLAFCAESGTAPETFARIYHQA